MAKLSTDANIGKIRLQEASSPSTPASGYGYVYAKTDGIYFMGDDGIEHKLAPVDYVDGLAVNLGKRGSVRAATTANITISTALNNGDSLDGVTLATGDLVLVKNQSAAEENGIYVVGVSPARSSEFDTYNEHPGSLIAVEEGTVNADTLWLCTSNEGGTLNTTAINFTQFTFSAGNIEDSSTAETDTSLVLAPNGAGGVEFRAETGGGLTAKQPDDISTLKFWVKADQIGGLSDNDPVGTWSDQSGNGLDLTASGTARPTYKTNIINGLPVVRFDGSSDGMRRGTGFTLGQFVVMIITKATTLGVIYAHGDSDVGSYLNNNGGTIGLFRNSTSYSANLASGWNNSRGGFDLLEHHYSQGLHSLYRNGDLLLSTAAAVTNLTSASQPLNVGAWNNAGSLFYAGDIAEVIIFDGKISATDLICVRMYLEAKYGLT